MGKIHSGLVTLSNLSPKEVTRINFGPEAAWPKSLFMMQRCFMTLRYPVKNGKELVIINTHMSAYDNGEHRRHQMAMFKEFITGEYAKGNYVIAGGDWNQNPPIAGKTEGESKDGHLTRIRIDADYLPTGWTWAFDPSVPSNRMINEAYNPETTITTIIDFYLLSPNVELINIKTKDLKFKNADHQPVLLQARLKD